MGMILVLLWTSSFLKGSVWAAGADYEWCYVDPKCGPSTWRGACKDGKAQSPIDINLGNVEPNWTPWIANFNKNYCESKKAFEIAYNGHSVMIQILDGPRVKNIIRGRGYSATYVLNQAHFHWGGQNRMGSEHTVDDKRYNMEMHFVHLKSDFNDSLDAAVKSGQPDAALVIALFIEASSKFNHSGFQPIVSALENASTPSNESIYGVGLQLNSTLNLCDILPVGTATGFYHYRGSLTTPICAEIVQWNILKKPLRISNAQFKVFLNEFNKVGHPITGDYQPINDRVVSDGILRLKSKAKY